jgi:lipoyl(octanoyl) transferase
MIIEQHLIVRWLGQQAYLPLWEHMRTFTDQRHAETLDEIWFCEHEPVFTQGQNGKAEHVLAAGDIPIVKTDRGGQVTYHGPGQLMIYALVDLKRKKFSIRAIVSKLEQSIVQFLQNLNIPAYADCQAPGVYIDKQKIASVGLRVRKGCVYHGLAFNVRMDLQPFNRINPCGFSNLKMAQLSAWYPHISVAVTAQQLLPILVQQLAYTDYTWDQTP